MVVVMHTTICEHCGLTWSLLEDGSLVEHAQPGSSYLLCPGSRTRGIGPDMPKSAAVYDTSMTRLHKRRPVAALSASA
jgi:hypothetical protein